MSPDISHCSKINLKLLHTPRRWDKNSLLGIPMQWQRLCRRINHNLMEGIPVKFFDSPHHLLSLRSDSIGSFSLSSPE